MWSFLGGSAENAGVENVSVENAGVGSRGGKYRSDYVWKPPEEKTIRYQ